MTPKIGKFAPLLLIAALLPAAYLAWTARDMPHFGHMHDDSVYFVCAKALAEGSGYRLLSFPGEPYQVKYPPLYPLLLSLAWKIDPSFPGNLSVAMLISWAMMPLYVFAARRVMADLRVGSTESWLLAAVIAVSPYVVLSSTILLSELLFGAMVFLCLNLAQRSQPAPCGTWRAAMAGALGGAAYLTRVSAIPLLGAVPLWFLLRRQPKRAVAFIAAMLPAVVAWTLWIRAHPFTVSDPALYWYGDYSAFYRSEAGWSDLPIVVWNNLGFLLSSIGGEILIGYDLSVLGMNLLRIVALLALAGVIRMARRDGMSAYHWLALGSLPLLLAYHYPPNQRYLLPFYPLLLAGGFTELRHLTAMLASAWRNPERAGRVVAVAMGVGVLAVGCLAVVAVYGYLTREVPAIIGNYRPWNDSMRPAYEWVRRNLPPDATFLAYHDPLLYLHTGNRAMRRPMFMLSFYQAERESRDEQASAVGTFARKQGLQYLLLSSMDFELDLGEAGQAKARAAILSDPALEMLHQLPNATMFRVKNLEGARDQ